MFKGEPNNELGLERSFDTLKNSPNQDDHFQAFSGKVKEVKQRRVSEKYESRSEVSDVDPWNDLLIFFQMTFSLLLCNNKKSIKGFFKETWRRVRYITPPTCTANHMEPAIECNVRMNLTNLPAKNRFPTANCSLPASLFLLFHLLARLQFRISRV